jgi:CBS domain-containing protein
LTAPLPQDQLDRIERFINAYNAIDRYLREYFRSEKYVPFSQLVREYRGKNVYWRDDDELQVFADLRNYLVHERTEMYQYLSVPTPGVVEQIEGIRDRLIAPERVFPAFRRKVVTVQAGDSLMQVLATIAHEGFSQFPVYEGERFTGLLTESGITRWLAGRASRKLDQLDLDEVTVAEVLVKEDGRRNCLFVPRDLPLLEAAGLFAQKRMLEALLITETGRETQTLLGIVTRWDMFKLME